MGYIVGAQVAEAFGEWQYALRVSGDRNIDSKPLFKSK